MNRFGWFAAAVVVGFGVLSADGKTTLDYEQDGLIAVWDGFENDGAGGHAEMLTEWKDTKGEYSFVFNADSGITVDGSALVFAGVKGCFAKLDATGTAATFDLARNGTLEVVFKAASDRANTSFLLRSSGTSGIAAANYSSQMSWIVSNTPGSPKPVLDGRGEVTTLVVHYVNGLASAPYVNGQPASTSGSDYWSSPQSITSLGAAYDGNSPYKGEIYAVRLYSKQLTAAQIAANRAVDAERFIEGNTDPCNDILKIVGSPVNIVPVTPAYGEVKGLAVGASFTCSAPAVWTNAEQKIAYACGGYTVTTNDCVYLSGSGNSFTYTHPDCQSGARLVWTWVPQGITSWSYVQDGLVHQWDALENVGIGLSDRTANVWADLKGNVGLTLHDANTTWTSNSLHRTASTYVFASAAAAIPGVRTLELTFKRSAYQQYAVLASLEGDVNNGRGLLTMKNNGLGSTYHGYHNHYGATHGDFVTVAFYPDLAKCDTNLFVNGEAMKATSDSEGWGSGMMPAFALGGRAANAGVNHFCGDIYACRLYDRRLTPRELLKNAYFDGVRYNGQSRTDEVVVRGEPAGLGASSPAYGKHSGISVGESMDFTVPAAWTNEEKTTIAVCCGYKVYADGVVCEDVTFEGEGEHTFTYIQPESFGGAPELALQWVPMLQLDAAVEGDGSVSADRTGWMAEGEQVTVTATPNDDESIFAFWSGDGVAPEHRLDNPYVHTLAAGGNRLTANFYKRVYVSATGSDANGGTGWDDALATVTAALDRVTYPYVMVDEGVYPVNRAIVIEKPAVVCGSGARGSVIQLVQKPSGDVKDKTHGVFYIDNPDAGLTNLAVTGKARAGYGRGVYLADGRIEDCAITNCATPNLTIYGGGIYMKKGVVRNCLVDNNICNSSGGGSEPGGGIYMTGGLVENCTITRNQATYGTGSTSRGGGVYMTSGTVRNCLIAKNQAAVSGFGIQADGGTVENCTIADNFYAKASSGCGVVAAAGVTFRNNIVWGNTNPGGLANASVSATQCTNNDCEPALAGADNVAVNPNFNDDYTLNFSTCVNGGLLLDWMEDATDLAGNPRVVGDRPDMGCFERSAGSGVECSFTATSDGAADSSLVTLEAQVDGDTVGVVYYWKVWGRDGNLVEEISGADCGTTVVTLGADSYTVSLAVTNGAGKGAAPAPVEDAVKVYATRVYVSENGTNVRPYATPESGAHDFETAFGLLASGGTAYVDDGVYEIKNRILLGGGKGTKVISLNGPENCVIRPAASGATFASLAMPMFEMTAADARIEGMTLAGGRKGKYNAGGEVTTFGTVKMGSSSVVTNCVIRDVTGVARGPSGAGANMTAGTIIDTVFDNICEEMSGGSPVSGVALTMSGGTAERLVVTNCLSGGTSSAESLGCVVRISGGVIRNSLVADCTGSHAEPVYLGSGATMENCSIVHNANTETEATRGGDKIANRHCGGLGVAAGATVVNVIVADNTSRFCGNVESNLYMTAAADLTACLVPDRETLPGEGHVFRHPKYRRGGYKLRKSSPGVNQGVVRDWMDGAKDIEGQPRVQGVAPDIGCYEFSATGMFMLVR